MTSNCYIVWDDVTMGAIVIDPASEHSLREIEYLTRKGLHLDYILLTHEHTDHTWGVNALLDKYDTKVICSEMCKELLSKASDAYFKLYFDRDNYSYKVKRVDNTIEELKFNLKWNDHVVNFINTPGHSEGSICFDIDGMLFTGDTIMQYKSFISKKGGNKDVYINSINNILSKYSLETIVFPGHGNRFQLENRSLE